MLKWSSALRSIWKTIFLFTSLPAPSIHLKWAFLHVPSLHLTNQILPRTLSANHVSAVSCHLRHWCEWHTLYLHHVVNWCPDSDHDPLLEDLESCTDCCQSSFPQLAGLEALWLTCLSLIKWDWSLQDHSFSAAPEFLLDQLQEFGEQATCKHPPVDQLLARPAQLLSLPPCRASMRQLALSSAQPSTYSMPSNSVYSVSAVPAIHSLAILSSSCKHMLPPTACRPEPYKKEHTVYL